MHPGPPQSGASARPPIGPGFTPKTGSAAGRALRATGRGLSAAGRATGRGFRDVVNARGAGESGLGRMTYLHLAATVADTLVVTALAGTIFFSVTTDAARGRVALSLAVTVVPFALLAPLIGPLLDRAPHGRRYALAASMVVRAFLAWVMAGGVNDTGVDIGFYLAACGFLVCQKVYLVTRAAAVPSVLPAGTELVAANARLSLSGVVAMIVAAPLGAGLTATAGPTWTLRLAFAVFAGGTALALMLPAWVDAPRGPGEPAAGRADDVPPTRPMAAGPARRGLGHRGTTALRGNAALRAFTGFLTLFLAFRLRTDPLGGLSPGTSVALVIAVFGVGNGLGTAVGGLLRRVRPDVVVVVATGVAAAVCGVAAVFYGTATVVAGAFAAGLAQGLAKLCLDALIQSDVPESVRTGAFARSETVLQLAWVAGGGVGLVAPLPGPWGLGLGALLVAIAVTATVRSSRRAT
ncbi:MFS transporter [Spongisporangium articulatum]|uniref:MFS transporter n=1 Tax=Spongisporangium articulatum TaxID=3362603 RepID=A0ABW8ARF0_9ACTN